jgi:predicted nucleic acid-binding protein
MVLATALAGKADVIVTGDEDLLVLKKFGGIRIVSPRQFLKLL